MENLARVRGGGNAVIMQMKPTRFPRLRLWIAGRLIRLAHKIAGVTFDRPVLKVTRAERRRMEKHNGAHN